MEVSAFNAFTYMKIALLGDIALIGSFDLVNNPNAIKKLSPVSDYLKGFDHVVANLEAPFSIKKKKGRAKSAYLCSDLKNVEILKALHIDIVSLANNHMFDYGREGFETTKHVLDDAGIKWFGAEGVTIKCDNFIFDGFCCYSTNPLQLVGYGDYGLNRLDIQNVSKRLENYKCLGLFPILSIHAGIEHVNTPSVDNILMSRIWSKITPYVYYGHHPHVLQGIEMHNGSLIAHSLGNFIFDDLENVSLSNANRDSGILELNIECGSIIDYCMTPLRIGNGTINVSGGEHSIFENQGLIFDEALKSPDKYTAKRIAKRLAWVNERKKKRNFAWLLKRLNWRYAELWWTNRQNIKKYNKYVKNNLQCE